MKVFGFIVRKLEMLLEMLFVLFGEESTSEAKRSEARRILNEG